jgi:23S rRNA pseudouridine1911/1915/1917 synthase
MIFSSAVPSNVRKSTTLLDYLAGRFTYRGREAWADIAAQGKITVNSRLAGAGDTVAPGDRVAYDAGDFEEPAADLSYRIIFEDEWLLGIDKPGNLLVHRAGKSFRSNLIYQLKYIHEPPFPEAHACHRLDRETSGVVCVAKSAAVKAALGRRFAEGKVEKTYVAVTQGIPEVREIDIPISKTAAPGASYLHGVARCGKDARTLIVACRPVGRRHAAVTVRPITGRTHQIRVHLAAVGAPIVGDRLYGTGRELFPRQALHCASLSFVHPVTGKQCRIQAEMPADMKDLMIRL